MKIANLAGRAVLLGSDGAADLERASNGKLPSDPVAVLERWDETRELVADLDVQEWAPFDETALGPPVPRPRQSLGIGLNYRAHAAESGWAIPEIPLLFSKLPGSLVGPYDDVLLPSDACDWEVELVLVIGRLAEHVGEETALDFIAGYSIGQDISERRVQRSSPGPQLTLGKSYRTFGPCGPAITTLDELDDPEDLVIRCEVNGEEVQASKTSDLIFGVRALIAFLSECMPLYPGDLIFTGTPEGVGSARRPPRYLVPGDVITSSIEGLGWMRNSCQAAPGS
ncbi:MAG: fumarylacetoacetate hydrolase family protein [Acidimicrobiales bacterium]|nr:fumarylacetoacetate hydrolase family protein [Acidimicrobiales bacterium]